MIDRQIPPEIAGRLRRVDSPRIAGLDQVIFASQLLGNLPAEAFHDFRGIRGEGLGNADQPFRWRRVG